MKLLKFTLNWKSSKDIHCVKSVHIWSYSAPYFQKKEKKISSLKWYFRISLRKKCPYSELFWSAFSRIQCHFKGDIFSSSFVFFLFFQRNNLITSLLKVGTLKCELRRDKTALVDGGSKDYFRSSAESKKRIISR